METEEAWSQVRGGVGALLVDLGPLEVIEFAAGDRFYLQVGRLPDEIRLLASGPATPDFQIGEVDEPTGTRLAALGFVPPDGETPSWAYTVVVPTEPLTLELAAVVAVEALRQVEGVEAPSDLVWSSICAGDRAKACAARLGIPGNPFQEG